MTFHVPNQLRVTEGFMASDNSYGNNGLFVVRIDNKEFIIIASDQMGWEHVSVSTDKRTPTWREMCEIKDMFWDLDDCVMQLHPPQKEYVNNHTYCLHLWRPINAVIPQPPSLMVGIKTKGPLNEKN